MRALGVLVLWGANAFAADATEILEPPRFTAEPLRADLRELDRVLHAMPADLSHSVDERDLARAIQEMDRRLAASAAMTRDEAWREFATLNPLLADGHLFVGYADWRADTRAHLAGGGRLFPWPIRVSPACELRAPGEARLLAVNGRPAREICEQMMARVHGDTRAFRADLLSRRFWFFHWKLFGAPEHYTLTLDPGGRRIVAGSTGLPDLLADEASFERQFRLTLPTTGDPAVGGGVAVLRLGTFAWPDKDRVLAFTKLAFETLRRENVPTLLIDLRDNGGGNDDQWIEGIMPYIATSPFRTASTYRKRVVTPDPAKNEVAGAVEDGEIGTWYPPQPDNPARFRGQVQVAIGPGTYSSAVVMSTVVQDFGFGQLVGVGDAVRANQSGGTRSARLPHTGLMVVTPRFVLRRPSGAAEPRLLTPDAGPAPGAPR